MCIRDRSDADEEANFIELGLDSLNLTQVALQLQKTFAVKITFRQLMAEYSSLRRLAELLDQQMPAESQPVPVAQPMTAPVSSNALPTPFAGLALSGIAPVALPVASANESLIQQVIQQQMQVMSQQLAMLSGMPASQPPVATAQPALNIAPAPVSAGPSLAPVPAAVNSPEPQTVDDDPATPQTSYDVKKAFGAIARIHTNRLELSPRQQEKLRAFIDRYVARTRKSKEYTQEQMCIRDRLQPEQAISPDYWAHHLRAPVRFSAALGCVIESAARVLLEVGPRSTLAGLAKQRLSGSKSYFCLLYTSRCV